MTVTTSSRELVDHPAASKRRRMPDEPAFVRGSPKTGYLAALLNIYHEIPLAREALLLPSMRVHAYGYDPQWWSGTSDENTKSLSIEDSGRTSRDTQVLLAEVQCLMAFLDGTDRAYASVDALADLRAYVEYNAETQFSRLLDTWRDAALRQMSDEQLTEIFSSVAMKDPNCNRSPLIEKVLMCLEPPVNRQQDHSLVDLLDRTVWNDAPDNLDDVWIHHFAGVFTMRLYDPTDKQDGLDLDIPAEWYPDRYMYERRAAARKMRQEVQDVRKKIAKCTAIKKNCEIVETPDGRKLQVQAVLDSAAKACSLTVEQGREENPVNNSQIMATDVVTTVEVQHVEKDLQDMLRRIDEKLTLLENKRSELQAEVEKIARWCTQPSADLSSSPRHKYVLQGVSTKPEITYIRRRNTDLINLDESEEPQSDWQWWRISWFKDDMHQEHKEPLLSESQPYSVRKMPESEVLRAAKEEHSSVVLVYANENAISFKGTTISHPLREFIEHDNRAFEDELREEIGGREPQRSDISDDTIFEDVSLDNQSNLQDITREMTPMAISNSPRDVDGQPSPKRPKSSDDHESRTMSDEPPPYEEPPSGVEMREKRGNKIGMHADRMLERYGGESSGESVPPLTEEVSRFLPR